jgi:hypothetical protein
MESNHHSTRHRVYSAESSPDAQRPRDSGLGPRSGPFRGLRAVVNPLLRIRDLRCQYRVADRVRTGADGAHNPGCFRYTTATTKAGTTGLEPAASRLTSECSARLSYAPEEVEGGIGSPQPEAETLSPPVGGPIVHRAGGIRTHDLELMRLARTAAPLPRKSGWQESNLRSPAPEAGGVATLPYSQSSIFEHPRRGSNPQLPG